jgi:hypothetical protein
MLNTSSRNNKKWGSFRNRRVQGTNLNLYNPKVTTVGFNTEKKQPKTWTPLPPPTVNNDKDFPPLDSYSPPKPLVLSPINQVLGSWSYDSNLPPPEVLFSKVKHQRKEPSLQFDERNESLDINLHGLLVATNKVYKNQMAILNEMIVLKARGEKEYITIDSLLFKKLLDFVKQNKMLIALCKHVRC